jgi:hypothetical protein
MDVFELGGAGATTKRRQLIVELSDRVFDPRMRKLGFFLAYEIIHVAFRRHREISSRLTATCGDETRVGAGGRTMLAVPRA